MALEQVSQISKSHDPFSPDAKTEWDKVGGAADTVLSSDIQI